MMLLPCGRCKATRVILLQFEFWDVIQNLIPYVRQMVLAYISIEGWIVHPDINTFFCGSDEVLVLSSNNAEILNGGIMLPWWQGSSNNKKDPGKTHRCDNYQLST